VKVSIHGAVASVCSIWSSNNRSPDRVERKPGAASTFTRISLALDPGHVRQFRPRRMGLPMTDDERAIHDLVEIWMAASRAGDAATVLGLMEDDIIFMVPGREPFGKEAFAANAQAMKGARLEGAAQIRELKVLGDFAYVRNHIDLTITPPGGTPMRRSGYTLTILHKGADGKWRLSRDANLVM
jgi:uncharacterized protein (TIGR02246 family)